MAAAWQILARTDQALAAVIRAVGPCPLEPSHRQPYEALLSAIAHQQLHGAAASAILARLAALGGRNALPTPDEMLAHPEEALRGAGLSRSKLLAMRDVAAKALDGTVPDLATIQSLDDESIIERLTAVRGVGRWTAQMLLIGTLGRPDVMPADDFGVRLGYQWAYALDAMPTPRVLLDATAPFAPYRSTVALYLWRYVDLRRADGSAPSAAAVRRPAPKKSSSGKAKGPKARGLKAKGLKAKGLKATAPGSPRKKPGAATRARKRAASG